jgi:Bacterial sugar transferase
MNNENDIFIEQPVLELKDYWYVILKRKEIIIFSLIQTPLYKSTASIEIKSGLTGLAQVYAPRDVTRRRKFKYDLLYIRKKSFYLDVKLILLSFWITLKGKWESREKK